MIGKQEPDPRVVYADYIDMPHHVSPTRPHMSAYDRAAQFAPFAALSGYSEMIDEEERLVDEESELSEGDIDNLNRNLMVISDNIASGIYPTVSITFFKPDFKKTGGKYVTEKVAIYSVDAINKQLILLNTTGRGNSRETIDIKRIRRINPDCTQHPTE